REAVDQLAGLSPAAAIDTAALAQLQSLAAEVAELRAATPRRVIVERQGVPAVEITGAVHPAFEEVYELATARENVFLPGPAGCGKSHIAHQVADALGLRFGSISCSAGMSESQLLGRMVPQGKSGAFEFLGTQFLDCYENGGVFLFDEIDAADSNVLLVVNSALANGAMSVPSRPGKPVAKRHADFVCIAAANTYGRGADRIYCGRNPLDEATLDRFRLGTVDMGYDRALERQLWDALGNGADVAALETLWQYRERIESARLERVLSSRFIMQAAKALARGRDLDYVASKLFKGWRQDEVSKVKSY
ncbi:MAG: AAA family ATPase, partial [Pirellulales bacterium]|nr:AAA family ATPase [Pirellulales bacterium]